MRLTYPMLLLIIGLCFIIFSVSTSALKDIRLPFVVMTQAQYATIKQANDALRQQNAQLALRIEQVAVATNDIAGKHDLLVKKLMGAQ